jgi:hypothetical protein
MSPDSKEMLKRSLTTTNKSKDGLLSSTGSCQHGNPNPFKDTLSRKLSEELLEEEESSAEEETTTEMLTSIEMEEVSHTDTEEETTTETLTSTEM